MNPLFRVKVCGLTDPADAALAVRLGADALGVVLWPSSARAVDAARATRILAGAPPHVLRVGVFVDASLDDIARAVETCVLDAVQLAGTEPPAHARALASRTGVRVVRSVHVDDVHSAARFADYPADIFLLDAPRAAGPGGTGRAFERSHARTPPWPVTRVAIAGGLNADNVAAALAAVPAGAVDVCSGVERSPGRKDADALRRFIDEAQRALASGAPLIPEPTVR